MASDCLVARAFILLRFDTPVPGLNPGRKNTFKNRQLLFLETVRMGAGENLVRVEINLARLMLIQSKTRIYDWIHHEKTGDKDCSFHAPSGYLGDPGFYQLILCR